MKVKKRPVNLDLTTFKFPISSITSILHRVSGVVLFLAVPLIFWALQLSLKSGEGYESVVECFNSPLMKLVNWALLSALAYHLVAGIRHLLMDWAIGEELKSGQLGSKIVLIVSAILIVILGVWIW